MADVVIHIALKDGFVDDRVVVAINGVDVYDREEVSTRFQIGLADQTEATVSSGEVAVQVLVPSRDVTSEVTFEAEEETWLGISYLNEQVEVEVSAEPFRYM